MSTCIFRYIGVTDVYEICSAIVVVVDDYKFSLMGIFRLSNNNLVLRFNEALHEILTDDEVGCRDVYIFGDFNIDLLRNDVNSNEYSNLMNSLYFK